jgi:hypothetical protein
MKTIDEINQQVCKRAAEIVSLIKHTLDDESSITLLALVDLGKAAHSRICQQKMQGDMQKVLIDRVLQLHKEERAH